MKKVYTFAILAVMLLGVGPFWGLSSESGDQVSLTIYQQNLASVAEIRELEIKSGLHEKRIEGIPNQIIPTSLQVETLEGPNELTILEQSYHFQPITKESLLKNFIGKEIEVIGQGSLGYKTYKGALLSTSGGIILADKSGQIELIKDPVKFSFPHIPEELTEKPYLSWTVSNKGDELGKYKIRINYLTQGLNWDANYSIVLSESNRSDLTSWVSISNNSGKTFKNAMVNLVAGKLHRTYGNRKGGLFALSEAEAPKAKGQFEPAKFFEYHQYFLDRRTTLKDAEQKQLSFIKAKGIEFEKVYIYRGQVEEGVQVSINFINSEANGLGKPLPAGIVKLYQEEDGGLKFIGEDAISHIPKDETVKLKLGTVFDIIGERKRTDHQKIDDKTFIDSYQITLRNHKEKEVPVKVIENIRGSWEIIHSSPKFEKLDAQRIAFDIKLAAEGEKTIRYTVKYSL